jgi:hypothetical protein
LLPLFPQAGFFFFIQVMPRFGYDLGTNNPQTSQYHQLPHIQDKKEDSSSCLTSTMLRTLPHFSISFLQESYARKDCGFSHIINGETEAKKQNK